MIDAETGMQLREQSQRELAAELARRRQWAVDHLGTQKLTVGIEIHQVEDDGSLHASLGPIGSLVRRPRSDKAWAELADMASAGAHAYRWSDSSWGWALHTWEASLAPGALGQVQAQLRHR